MIPAEAVDEAADRLAPVLRRTALERSDRLSEQVGMPVWLKREDVQECRSYKSRGAYNLISSLGDDERARGVICASAGNHGQGLAFACRQLRIRGRVFLPTGTPRQKRERIAAIGGEWVRLVIAGATYDESSALAHAESAASGAVYVHPFDDPRTIAGQGTVGRELVLQAEAIGVALDTIIVPIGGGGLIAGLATWVKTNRPQVRVVGAEPVGAASMTAALAAGEPVAISPIDTFVDGAAVGRAGEYTVPVVAELVDEVLTVPEGAVCTEMLELYATEGIIAEPAGALATAAARQLAAEGRAPTGPVACIISGGNNDVSRYAEVVERSLLHEGLRHYFLVTFSQEPGALRRFLDEVLVHGEDIVAFEYVKKNNRETGPALVGIDLERAGDLDGLQERMAASRLDVERIPPGSPLFTFLL